MSQPTVQSILVGRTRRFDSGADSAKPWTSGIVKSALAGEVHVGRTNIEGDEQADLKHHGGIDKAVLGYASCNYEHWRDEFPEVDWQAGAFGENLTIAGLDESSVCIGDVYSLGQCKLEVSQPRQPCWKLARLWQLPQLPVQVQRSGRTGFYFRVAAEGTIEPGLAMTLEDRPCPQWTIASANEVMYAKGMDLEKTIELASCPPLSQSWKQTLGKRIERKRSGDQPPG